MTDKATSKPVVLSGVQPTGKVHIGNYVGALSLWAENQHQYDNLFCVVDLHALTIPETVDPPTLRRKTREVAALYIACGIDPDASAIFVQSDVKEHAELCWILNCVTPLGWLYRMTQFKSKSEQRETVGTGLLTYPVLQAADILLYQTHFVPVGEDQRQHIELTREVAQRFNSLFGPVFRLPEVMVRTSGARIMALDDPTQKMSKSVGEKIRRHSIGLLDDADSVRDAIMSATTDSGRETRFAQASPGVKNLLTLYAAMTGSSIPAAEERFAGAGYGTLKRETADAVISVITPIQSRWNEIMGDVARLDAILDRGAAHARALAAPFLAKIKEAAGLGK